MNLVCVCVQVSSVEGEEVTIQLEGGLLGKGSTHTAPGESPDTCDYHVTAIVVCTGMEVCVGEEIVSCVLSVEGEEVWVSLNPALLERCDLKTEGGDKKKKKKRRSSTKKQAMVSRTLSNSLSLYSCISHSARTHGWRRRTHSWRRRTHSWRRRTHG